MNMTELTAPVVKRNDEKRIVYGPVLIPGEPDHDGDIVSIDKIEQVAHDFAEKYGNIDLMHSLNNVGKMVETYLSPADLTFDEVVVPKGSWMIGVRVTDEKSWEAVKSGNGFSIMGIRSTVAKSKEETSAVKRTTLADLGEDWLVNAVSLVDEPAVPKAKFLVVKSKDESTTKDSGFFAKLKQALSRSEEAAVKEEDEMTKEDVQLFIQSAVKTAIQEAITSLPEEQEPSATPLDDLQVVDEEKSKNNSEDANEQKDQVMLSKQEYESLLNRVNEIEGDVEKARGYGLFFRSNKLKGQDSDAVQQNQLIEQDRDIFGRRIQK
jgi:hypothetical protein